MVLDAFFRSAALDLAKNGTRTILAAPGAKKELWIHGFYAVASAAGTVALQDGDGNSLTGAMPVATNGEIDLGTTQDSEKPWVKCAENTAFQAVLSANVDLDGIVIYQIRQNPPT